jgi:hypothetical protein
VSNGSKSQHRGHPCRLGDLEAAARAETHRRAAIHHQMHQRLTFLAVDFQMSASGARGGAPVHVADVVAGAVQARLLEVEPAAEPARGPVAGMVVVDLAQRLRRKQARLRGKYGHLCRRDQRCMERHP